MNNYLLPSFHSRKCLNTPVTQRGFVLLFVMITLFTLSFLVFYAYERAIMQAKMASNMQNHIQQQYEKNVRMNAVYQRMVNQTAQMIPTHQNILDDIYDNKVDNLEINYCTGEPAVLKTTHQETLVYSTPPSVQNRPHVVNPMGEIVSEEDAMTPQQQTLESNLSQATRSVSASQRIDFETLDNLKKLEKMKNLRKLEELELSGVIILDEEDEA